METTNLQVITTGSGITPIPPETDAANMAENSIPAPASTGSSNTWSEEDQQIINLLSLLQTDYFDLQGKRLPVYLDGSEGVLGAIITWPGHTLGFENGRITVDGDPV